MATIPSQLHIYHRISQPRSIATLIDQQGQQAFWPDTAQVYRALLSRNSCRAGSALKQC